MTSEHIDLQNVFMWACVSAYPEIDADGGDEAAG